jgi:ribonuclease Y
MCTAMNKKLLDVLGRLQFRHELWAERAAAQRRGGAPVRVDGGRAGAGRGDWRGAAGCCTTSARRLDHEAEGSHTKVGYELARRLGNEPAAVLNAIVGHHGDVAATHPYTPLVTAADAMSAARPGGRRESIERYMKRLRELEGIATSFDGVEQAYAIEAGREVRVIVDANRIEDRSALKLARDVAKKIEDDVGSFPGEIKITVLREVRATEYAISGKARGNGDRFSANAPTMEETPPEPPSEQSSEDSPASE